jgi:hypothetical protein
MESVASTAGAAAALVGTQEGKEANNGIQHDTRKDDTKPTAATSTSSPVVHHHHHRHAKHQTVSSSPEEERRVGNKDQQHTKKKHKAEVDLEKERREGGGHDEKERSSPSASPARPRASPAASPHTVRARQTGGGVSTLPALSLSTLTQQTKTDSNSTTAPAKKKNGGSWRRIGSGPLKKTAPHQHDDNGLEQHEDHEVEIAQFMKVLYLSLFILFLFI